MKKLVLLFITVIAVSFCQQSIAQQANAVQQNTQQLAEILSLDIAVAEAIANDDWLAGNELRQQALLAKSRVVGTLPDPMVSLSLANLPLDSFDFSQEGMTQLKVGVSQKFARGDSLALKQRQLRQQSLSYPYMRANRQAKLSLQVQEIWYRLFQTQRIIELITKDRRLFEQLVDVAESSYASTSKRTRQTDVIRAQLELTQLDDRLSVLAQQQSALLARLSQWLPKDVLQWPLSQEFPKTAQNNTDISAQYLMRHPAILAISQRVKAMEIGINVAKQGYQPQWGVNASYGYRSDSPSNMSRADLFSIGLTFDVPLFSKNKQDQNVNAAIANTSALKTDQILLLRKMSANAKIIKDQLTQLKRRQKIYQGQLLPQMHEQAQAALNAYSIDNGEFSEVMRARISELNSNIAALKITIEQQILKSRLNYYLLKDENLL
ncbi:MAG: TolC family protein [Psychrobium sp.]|nr:TolC family protein [Psychrobium sp.]